MTIKEVENAIEVLRVIQLSWADTVENEGQKIADFEALYQSRECLKEWIESHRKIKELR